ncbi:iron complex transport system ATP-binding protein [Paenibacillus cellulosilyticus]|uniref:Iron complex transport system ATP-binding protein n=1 Tax=Paenibacillus cellulosilyticus TaxID=375489 RepID=A0A2V2Z1K2_9BACL|nr:ABC transporter ATP-binding protein [Paenibacillus cellulosilyticus]PWW06499.1 iron complex transport system ATP-binding protein [Paenibacillus cellulosilyticus]QKS46162.1 ABC transporter ATP-binding protein [Paenibacillus cellulosilyticus]
MIEARQVSLTIEQTTVVKDMTFSFTKPGMYGIIGPNGAGKTSLLRLMSGAAQPTSGSMLLGDKPISAYPRKALARTMAVLQQGGLPPVGFSVRDTVAMGRFAFQGWFGDEREDPSPLIDSALNRMGLIELQHRPLDRLSGGERQRAALAQIMVQNPHIMLLDEPTTYLDIGYQVQLLETVHEWQRERGMIVVAVLHDLNLASLYCDQLIVMKDGSLYASGTPETVITKELVHDVYHADAEVIYTEPGGPPQIVLHRAGVGMKEKPILDRMQWIQPIGR